MKAGFVSGLLLTLLTISSLSVVGYANYATIINKLTKSSLIINVAPKSLPAHVSEEFSLWKLPQGFRNDLWKAVEKAPVNKKTGKKRLMFTVVNEGMIDFAMNWACSLHHAKSTKNDYVVVCTDKTSYERLLENDISAVFLPSNFSHRAVNNVKIVDFYNIVKLRPTVLYQLLLWDAEVILSDVDIVFFKDFTKLFNEKADFEVQCDSKTRPVISGKGPADWSINLGFYKVNPTRDVLAFMPLWLSRMYRTPKLVDQKAFKQLLRRETHKAQWIASDTFKVSTENLGKDINGSISIRFLDPMEAVNAGGIWQDGRQTWITEAKKRNLKRPRMIHFFHIGQYGTKLSLMHENNLWFIDEQGKCMRKPPIGVQWPIWQ